ncbi:MAG: hypothetical protein H8E46_01860 [FCB group bacterium]|nr:hypothetical protein [FCB group bacterium]
MYKASVILIVLFLFTFVVLLNSCSEDEHVSKFDRDPLIPLALGNSWTYYVWMVVDGSEESSSQWTMSVLDTLNLGFRYYFVQYDTPETIKFLRANYDGVYRLISSVPPWQELLIWPDHVSVGDTFEYPDGWMTDDVPGVLICEGVNIEVINGDLNYPGCIQYHFEGETGWLTCWHKYWLKPGLGIVREEGEYSMNGHFYQYWQELSYPISH